MIHAQDRGASPDLADLVRSNRLQLLYRQSYPAIFISTFAAALLVAVLWSVQRHQDLIIWFGFIFLSAIPRLMLFSRYAHTSPKDQEILSWEKPYFITLMLTSIAWGIGSLFILPSDSMLHQAVVFCFLVALTGGAVSFYSCHFDMTAASISIILLPMTGYFLLSGKTIFFLLGVGAIGAFVSAIRAARFISRTLHDNFIMKQELEESNKASERLARTDDLTGMHNRRAFYEYGKLLADNCQRHGDDISMIHMDIDHFKKINDGLGHAAGDKVLQQVGQMLLRRLRKSDLFARLGGEEFGMLLPNTSLEQAFQLAEQIRVGFEHASFANGGKRFTVTASLGVSSGSYDVDTLVRQSDELMYHSKRSGRNMVTCYQSIKESGDGRQPAP